MNKDMAEEDRTPAEEVPEEPPVETDHYSEEAPLTYLFGDSARVKILAAFVAERNRDVSVSDIARLAGVARSTVYNHLDTLEKLGVIEHTRDIEDGHSALYQLNEDSQIAELCYKLDGVTLQKLLSEDSLS